MLPTEALADAFRKFVNGLPLGVVLELENAAGKKKMAGYHQFHAVQVAVAETLRVAELRRMADLGRADRTRYTIALPANGGARPKGFSLNKQEASVSQAKTSFIVLGSIVLGLIIAFGLSACSEQVSLCKEAMGMRADQLGVADKDRQKFIDNCRMSGGVYTVDQWQCLIAAMKKGTAYEEATEQCVP